MKLTKPVLLGVFGLALQGTAIAQIYESTDAEGVPEFSDTPTAGAEVVDLQNTNVADEPPDIPDAPKTEVAQPAPGPQSTPGEVGQPGYIYSGGDEDEDEVRARRRLDEERVEHALPGNQGPGVGAPGPGVEPHPGEGEPGEHHAPAGGHARGGRR